MSDPTAREDVIGQSVIRRDLLGKVTGAAEYTVDITMPGALHAKIVRSDRAHARILDIDASEALTLPGVVAVITSDDLRGLYPRFGHIIADHCILAIDKVRYYGEPVALVLAETVHEAADAAELVRVTYEDLAAVLDADQALAPGAPLVHEQRYASSDDDSFRLLTGGKGKVAAEAAAELSNVAH